MKSKLMPPSYFNGCLIVSFVLLLLLPIYLGIAAPYNYLGILLIAFGIVLNLWADKLIKKFETTVKPYEKPSYLITNGPFRISRHPMYFGMASILFGGAVIFDSLWFLICGVLYIISVEILFISKEENNMKAAFGEQFLEYKKKVRRWI